MKSDATLTEIRANATGERLDQHIANHLSELSRAAVQRLIDDEQIRVDGMVRKASYRVQAGEIISINIPTPEPAAPRAEKIPLDIVFENRDLVVVNKPAGMVVHPAAGHASHTLVNAILAHSPKLNVGGEMRPGIVHRIDRDTSGIIIVAKNDVAMRDLQAQFKNRAVKKTYLALVEGDVKPPRGVIDAPIGRDPKFRQKMKVLTRGKSRPAVTIYSTRAKLGKYTLLEAEPQTGRTHQIRVHLAFLGFPVVADEVYGKKRNALGLSRQFLHAWKIGFDLPRTGKRVELVAPPPQDLRETLAILGWDENTT